MPPPTAMRAVSDLCSPEPLVFDDPRSRSSPNQSLSTRQQGPRPLSVVVLFRRRRRRASATRRSHPQTGSSIGPRLRPLPAAPRGPRRHRGGGRPHVHHPRHPPRRRDLDGQAPGSRAHRLGPRRRHVPGLDRHLRRGRPRPPPRLFAGPRPLAPPRGPRPLLDGIGTTHRWGAGGGVCSLEDCGPRGRSSWCLHSVSSSSPPCPRLLFAAPREMTLSSSAGRQSGVSIGARAAATVGMSLALGYRPTAAAPASVSEHHHHSLSSPRHWPPSTASSFLVSSLSSCPRQLCTDSINASFRLSSRCPRKNFFVQD
mmetsp:Transcript_19099/g.61466  ORF Transcript_19099/g.61466 Transcript_19099/m.61466 type:complete len:313 (-) Transcript_19099:76-1014(-)